MITNEMAIEMARAELSRAMTTIETSSNRGLVKIAENKSDWLVKVIQMAESYCAFHWISCLQLMPENSIINSDKTIIPCIVAVLYKNNSEPVIEMRTRSKGRFGSAWRWSGSRRGTVVLWASLPTIK